MEATFFYLLQLCIVSGILYTFYKLIVSNTTFYFTNRVVLIGILLVSLSLPFVKIQSRGFVSPELNIVSPNLAQVTHEFVTENRASLTSNSNNKASGNPINFSWSIFFFVCYLTGVALFIIRLIFSYLQMRKIGRAHV